MSGGGLSARKITLVERRARAIELKKAGLSYRQIADRIRRESGSRYSPSMAYRDVEHAVKQVQGQMAEEAEAYLALSLMTLDDLMAAWYPLAIGADMASEMGVEALFAGGEDGDGRPRRKQSGKAGRELVLQLVFSRLIQWLQETAGKGSAQDAPVADLANVVRMVVTELRAEEELSKPDRDAARIVLDVIEKRQKLLGQQDSALLSVNVATAVGVNVENNFYESIPDEELDQIIANLSAAVAPVPEIEWPLGLPDAAADEDEDE